MKSKKQTKEETIHWKFSNQECYQILRAYRRLKNYCKIARIFHVADKYIIEVLEAMEVRRRVKRPLTIREKQIAAYLADKKGRSGKYIARQLNRDPSVILRFLHANGSRVKLPVSYMLSDIQKEMIKPMYDKGYSINVIGMWLGVCPQAIHYQLKKQGIVFRNRGKRKCVSVATLSRMYYLREHKGYTHERIGKEFHISARTVERYLTGKRKP
jgi:predicted transcriptional regulator